MVLHMRKTRGESCVIEALGSKETDEKKLSRYLEEWCAMLPELLLSSHVACLGGEEEAAKQQET